MKIITLEMGVSPPSRLRRLDARIKLVALLASCFVTQYLPEGLLPVWLAVLLCLFFVKEMRTAGVLSIARGGVYFTLFWLVMKAGSDMFGGKAASEALAGALPLAGRLAALTLAGVACVGLSSPIETGRAAVWFIRPVVGRRAWKPALAIALTAWFLPLTLRLFADALTAIRARGLKLSWRRKAVAAVGATLRILEKKADELALGLASRRVDDYRSWR